MATDAASISRLALRDGAQSAPRVYLSTSPAEQGQRRLALAAVLLSTLVFAAVAPFAKTLLPAVPAFLPVYQSALVIIDLITAVLLFGQFGILRSRALLLLASAYLFSAAMALCHMLSFPGLFAPGGLFGAGPQTTAWLYFLWHGGFPLLVIFYALMKEKATGAAPALAGVGPRTAIALSVLAVVAATAGLMLLTTAGHAALPEIMRGDRDASTKFLVAATCWLLSLIALPVLWRRRPHSLIDLWLMVTLCVWIFDIALASVLNAGRYDLGWYAGRIYGLLAGSFVLMVLLLENSVLHARVAVVSERERRHAQATFARHEERLRILHEIDRAIVGAQPLQQIAGAVIQPLRELLGVPRAIVNLFDLEAGEVEWLAAAGRSRTHVGPGVRYSLGMMGDVESLKRGDTQIVDTRALPPGPETSALLASGVEVYMVVPMIAGGQLIGAISFGGTEKTFPAEQVGIAHEVATQLAIAINQSQLLERVQRHSDELEFMVRERTTELQAANKELEAFSYSISHDLRAPLRGIIGFADALMEDHGADLSDEARRKIKIVQDEGRRLGVLIDELLAFSRLGRKPLQKSVIDMAQLARAALDGLHLQPGESAPAIDFGSLPEARGDRVLLGQVWANLLSNAVKFSAKNAQPRIEVRATTDANEHLFLVRDNGAGFDPKYQSKLFGVFQRLHDAAEFPGSGVGLALVQRIVNRHGGRVWAESRPGEGATFFFTLPKDQADGSVSAG
jgi:signal transduction histidine kinase